MPLGQLPLGKPEAKAVPQPGAVPQPETDSEPGNVSPEADLDLYAPRDDGGAPRQRVLPASLWDGANGDLLRQVGMSPDDEHNFVPDAQSLNEQLERGKAEYERKLAEMNARVSARFPGARMRGFSLLPDACWNGKTGDFLMLRLRLFPYEDWNLVFLPTDEGVAEALNLPIHPGRDLPDFVAAAEKLLAQAEMRFQAAVDEADRTQDFHQFGDAVEDIRDKVRALARSFLGEIDREWESRH
jgi:hypothetical protein